MSDVMMQQLADRVCEFRLNHPLGCNTLQALDWIKEQIHDITTNLVFEECGYSYKVYRQGHMIGILAFAAAPPRTTGEVRFIAEVHEDAEGIVRAEELTASDLLQIAGFLKKKTTPEF